MYTLVCLYYCLINYDLNNLCKSIYLLSFLINLIHFIFPFQVFEIEDLDCGMGIVELVHNLQWFTYQKLVL
jgi:hypothetical protein